MVYGEYEYEVYEYEEGYDYDYEGYDYEYEGYDYEYEEIGEGYVGETLPKKVPVEVAGP